MELVSIWRGCHNVSVILQLVASDESVVWQWWGHAIHWIFYLKMHIRKRKCFINNEMKTSFIFHYIFQCSMNNFISKCHGILKCSIRLYVLFLFLTGKCILKINYRNSSKLMGGKKMLWKITSILFSLFHIKKTETRPYKVYECGHSLQHFITRTYFPWCINFKARECSGKVSYIIWCKVSCKFWGWRQNSLLIPYSTGMHVS